MLWIAPTNRTGLLAGVLLCTLWLMPAQAADAPAGLDETEQRVALVIGNAGYETAPLRNPVNDARAMRDTLAQLGFTVTLVENGTQPAIKRAIDEFGDRLHRSGKNTVGLLYYSGHGVQVKGRNYIVPVGATIRSERQVEYESVDVARALAAMEDAGNALNIVILDACRDNPFASNTRAAGGGLAMMDAASGTLIAYATAPGRTADDGTGANGLYTEQLIRHMRTPGLKVEEVFKRVRADVERLSDKAQVPWESSSLKGDFYFAGSLAAFSPQGTGGLDEEAVLWRAIEGSGNPQDFDDYLQRYPEGRFALAARARGRQAREKAPPEVAQHLSALTLRSSPPGAEVYLDGALAGTTPLELYAIEPRRYLIDMRLARYRPWQEEVSLRAGQSLVFNEVLEHYTLSVLDVRSFDAATEIHVDGTLRGMGGGFIDDIEPGERAVEARRPRARPWRQVVRFEAGEIASMHSGMPSPYQVGVFPARMLGQYVNYVDTRYGKRTSGEWALLGVHEALTREPAVQIVYSAHDGFSVPRKDIPGLQKAAWKGLISKQPNQPFLRSKAMEMDLDAVVLMTYSDPGYSGPADVYVYDAQSGVLHHAGGAWQVGDLTESIARLTSQALGAFIKARETR